MLTKLTIQRSKWLTPDKLMYSVLYNEGKNLMCCLGFACIALGKTQTEILDCDYPSDVKDDNDSLKQIIGPTQNAFGSFETDAAQINDNKDITNEEREVKLIELFKTIGVELTFED